MTEATDGDAVLSSEVEAGLAEIRRRRLTVWIVWAGYIPTVLLVVLASKGCGIDPNQSLPFIAILYLALFAAVGIRSSRARCPRCHQRFQQRLLYGNPWTRSCLHCKLPLAAPDEFHRRP